MKQPFQQKKQEVTWKQIDDAAWEAKNPCAPVMIRAEYLRQLRKMYAEKGHAVPRWVQPLLARMHRLAKAEEKCEWEHPLKYTWGTLSYEQWETLKDALKTGEIHKDYVASAEAVVAMEREEQMECDPQEISGPWRKPREY